MKHPFHLDEDRLSQFRSNEALVDAIRPVLQSPVFQSALTTIEDAIPATDLPDQIPGVHHDTTVAHRLYWEQGARSVIRTLRKLGVFREPKEAVQEEEQFAHVEKSITL